MQLYGNIKMSALGAAGALTVTLPNSWAVDTGKHELLSGNTIKGRATFYDASDGSTDAMQPYMTSGSTTVISFIKDDATSAWPSDNMTTDDIFSFFVELPINGWDG
jgi:hypothetical protein